MLVCLSRGIPQRHYDIFVKTKTSRLFLYPWYHMAGFFLAKDMRARWEDFSNYVIFSQDKIFSDLSDLCKPQHSTMLSYALYQNTIAMEHSVIKIRFKLIHILYNAGVERYQNSNRILSCTTSP